MPAQAAAAVALARAAAVAGAGVEKWFGGNWRRKKTTTTKFVGAVISTVSWNQDGEKIKHRTRKPKTPKLPKMWKTENIGNRIWFEESFGRRSLHSHTYSTLWNRAFVDSPVRSSSLQVSYCMGKLLHYYLRKLTSHVCRI